MNNNDAKRVKRIAAKINDYTTIFRTDCFNVKSLSQSRNNPKILAFTEDQVIAAILHLQVQGIVTYNPEMRVGRLVRAA